MIKSFDAIKGSNSVVLGKYPGVLATGPDFFFGGERSTKPSNCLPIGDGYSANVWRLWLIFCSEDSALLI